jgi:hypothetical protein
MLDSFMLVVLELYPPNAGPPEAIVTLMGELLIVAVPPVV